MLEGLSLRRFKDMTSSNGSIALTIKVARALILTVKYPVDDAV